MRVIEILTELSKLDENELNQVKQILDILDHKPRKNIIGYPIIKESDSDIFDIKKFKNKGKLLGYKGNKSFMPSKIQSEAIKNRIVKMLKEQGNMTRKEIDQELGIPSWWYLTNLVKHNPFIVKENQKTPRGRIEFVYSHKQARKYKYSKGNYPIKTY